LVVSVPLTPHGYLLVHLQYRSVRRPAPVCTRELCNSLELDMASL
jgi:hypothetical protein